MQDVGDMLHQLLHTDAVISGLLGQIEDVKTNRIALADNN
jgi:hypothetical protein